MEASAPTDRRIDPDVPKQIWTARDIPRAVAAALDLRKLLVGGAGLFLAAFVFGASHRLGHATGERPALRVFTIIGLILASCVWVLFSGIVARMTLTELLEGRKAGASELRQFVSERWITLVGTPIAFGVLSLLLLGVMALLELIGTLPGLGPILFGSSFILAFLLAFLATLTALVHAMGAFLYPSIVALRGAGALGVVGEMFEIVRAKGIQLLACEAAIGVVGIVMTGVLGAVVWAGLYITHWSALAVMEEKFELSLGGIPEFFRVYLEPFERWLPYVPEPMEVAWHYELSGALLGLSLLWILVATAAYPFVFFTSAGSLTYLFVRGGGHGDAGR